jgi:hypothetical protein
VIYAGPEDKSSYTTYHAQVDRDCYLVTLGGPGAVGLIDRRSSETSIKMKICDIVSPNIISVHPTKQNVEFLAPIDEGCGMFDLRNQNRNCKGDQVVNSIKPLVQLATNKSSECKSLGIKIHNLPTSRVAVSSAFFSPMTGNKVVTISYDDKIKLFDTSAENLAKHYSKTLRPYQSIDHFTRADKTTTSFKAEWHPRHDDIFLIGSSNYPTFPYGKGNLLRKIYSLDVMSDQGNSHSLSGKQLQSFCSIVKCHPTQDFVIGADSHGKVHVFM